MTDSRIVPVRVEAMTDATRFNALRHGVLSRFTVLPWEDASAYAAIVAALVAEHTPQGPTEEHLVEELAGILWRKRRLRLAEGAVHRRGLERALESHRDSASAALVHLTGDGTTEGAGAAVRASDAETAADLQDLADDEAMTRRALDLLDSPRNDAYEAALAELRADTRAWWADLLACPAADLDEGETPATANVAGLRVFLDGKVMPWYARRRTELENRALIREQAFGESLDPDRMERLGRYEVHLDRKFERMLVMLLRLKDLRSGAVPG